MDAETPLNQTLEQQQVDDQRYLIEWIHNESNRYRLRKHISLLEVR